MTTRIRYFDIAKGIAILCVILGHSILTAGDFAPRGTTSNLLIAACFTFHMCFAYWDCALCIHGFCFGKSISPP